MDKIKKVILVVSIVAGVGLASPALNVSAIDIFPPCNGSEPEGTICNNAKNGNEFGKFIKSISTTLLFVLGAVAVITIIISGFRYTISHGDPKAIQSAKETMFYAVVGLIVAIMAYAIVNFIIDILPK
jgi:hypothetical protein